MRGVVGCSRGPDRTMSDFDLRLGETIVRETPCLYRRGILAHNGVATVTNRRFHFEPKSLDKLAGAKSVTLELLEMKKVSRKGVDGILEIPMPGVVHRLMGDGTKELETAIKEAIRALEQAAPDKVVLGPNEHALVVAPLELRSEGITIATGEVRKLCQTSLSSASRSSPVLTAPRVNWLRRLIHSPAQWRRKAPISSGGKGGWGLLGSLMARFSQSPR